MIAGVIIALCLVGSTVALVLQTINVGLKVTVEGSNLKFYDHEYNGGQPVTFIDFGTLERGKSKGMPEAQFYWLENVGNKECYIYYEFKAPQGITMRLEDHLSGEEIVQGTILYGLPYENTMQLRVRCLVGNETALGTYEAPDFMLTIYASDLSSGGP